MLTELRTKSQITIPKDIVMKMGLREGDKLEIVEKDGVIELMPVAVYQKQIPCTAIFAISDMLAIGAGKALSDAGYKVPEDISLAGFDGVEIGKYVIQIGRAHV